MRVVQQPLLLERHEHTAKLGIEEKDAIVIAVAHHEKIPERNLPLGEPLEFEKEAVVYRGAGRDPESSLIPGRGNERLVGVEVVQEREERPIGASVC